MKLDINWLPTVAFAFFALAFNKDLKIIYLNSTFYLFNILKDVVLFLTYVYNNKIVCPSWEIIVFRNHTFFLILV